ncbi:MAG: hypothetical protein QMC25_03275 [Porticoccaceae bacterium]
MIDSEFDKESSELQAVNSKLDTRIMDNTPHRVIDFTNVTAPKMFRMKALR